MKSRLNIAGIIQVVIIVLAFSIGTTGFASQIPKVRILNNYNSLTVKGNI